MQENMKLLDLISEMYIIYEQEGNIDIKQPSKRLVKVLSDPKKAYAIYFANRIMYEAVIASLKAKL